MKTKKYFMISALALLACSCQDEERGGAQPTPGQDVQFGATLEQSASRTVYGDRTDDAFPIYWENGDEVIVSSPECADNGGVGNANYKVNVGNNTTQNYATSLDKTGDIGVRWGTNQTGNFYSFYPASHAELGRDYKTMTVTMPAQQDNNFVKGDGTQKIMVNPDMNACFMYACSTANAGNDVNLRYIPLSTAIRFTLTGPESGSPVGISYVRIYAGDEIIDGSFTLEFSGTGKPTLSPQNGRNYVTMNAADSSTGGYLTLGPGESAELCAFLLIPSKMTITNDWYMEISTTDGEIFKKSLGALEGGNTTLVPGQVHYLPNLPALQQGGDWDAANWMANIQRNVYLSEISLPGSWNSVNDDCQHNGQKTNQQILEDQYKLGIRAFHLDTRWISNRDNGDDDNITGLGIADGGNTYTVGGLNCMRENSATTFTAALKAITDQVKDNEYMVLICTFAQGSYNYGNGQWRQAVSDACANNDKVFDGKNITPETVVGQVLGKVIVIVNTYTTGAISGSKCLFMNMGITLGNDFSSSNYFEKPLQYENRTNSGIMVYGTHAQITSNGEDETPSDRGYAPTLEERETKLNNILTWSKGNYDDLANYKHNAWMYLGLGGYVYHEYIFGLTHTEDYDDVAITLNGWIDRKIQDMPTSGYYPVGIVLMNQVEDYGTVIDDILQMNNKYRKAYDPHRSPVDGTDIEGNLGGGGSKTVHSAAPGYSSGMKDNQINAISWTRCR